MVKFLKKVYKIFGGVLSAIGLLSVIRNLIPNLIEWKQFILDLLNLYQLLRNKLFGWINIELSNFEKDYLIIAGLIAFSYAFNIFRVVKKSLSENKISNFLVSLCASILMFFLALAIAPALLIILFLRSLPFLNNEKPNEAKDNERKHNDTTDTESEYLLSYVPLIMIRNGVILCLFLLIINFIKLRL